jgi:hypothetical protein
MMLIRQFFLAVALSIVGLAASAQTTSSNLVPLPNHWTTNGQTIAQSYAINQALALGGSDVRINGFDYGYQYNLGNSWTQCTAHNQDGSCSWTMTFNPRVDVNVSIRDNNNAQIYGTTHIETGANTGNRSRDFQYRFNDPRDLLTLGNFNYTASTSPNATVFGMYSRAVYTVVESCATNPQSNPSCPGYKTYYNNMWDDGHVRVDLPFTFPLYGRTFTTSYMFTNGVVGFLDPFNSFCCSGINMNNNPGPYWNYAIYGLQTDLGPGHDSRFWSQVGDNGTSMRYGWDRVYDLGTNNASTFNIQIKDTGYIGINYESVNSQYHITAGIAGDISQGEYSQIYHGWGGGFNPAAQYTFTGTEITDQCANNPLWSTTCPGYQQAYFNQQCSYNPLYNSQCPGYQQAYFTQQCSMNTLYDPMCPGYATAYYNYQCSANALYHTGCPGYATAYFDQQCGLDPLYNNQCPGYATAYFDQQCGLDPLYNNQCPGYADAYYVQQCTASPLYDSGCNGYDAAYLSQQCNLDTLYNSQCPGYETAYFNQQCSLNTLYNSQCPGYETAYFNQQCSISALYNDQCPGYATAYFNQQCGLDALYNNQCPGYGEAYAKKFILVTTPVAETAVVAELETVVVAQATVVETKEAVAVAVATEPAPAPTVSASPAAAATAPVSLVAAPAPAPAAPAAEKKAEAKTETKTETAAAGGASESKSKPTTTRQALAQRRLEAAREKAAESANTNPGAVSSQMDSAASMEQQVELQNVVLGAMGFVAGFDAYGRVNLQDAAGYKPFEIYRGQKNVDTPAARGLLGRSDRLHQDMVDSQYNK